MNINDEISKLQKYAKENNVPIMLEDGLNFLTNYIKENNIKNILEIGTAIGYSAIKMALIGKDIKVTTIERDEERYIEAKKNIKKFNLEEQITLIHSDAFEVNLNTNFDLIFIDAAKAQNIKFFEKFENNLRENGTIITDNLNFHGLVNIDEKEITSRNVRGIVRKTKAYIEYLKNNSHYQTTFYSVGDGISISIKK
ncbi:MAG: O-methyltransferase [bacterium]|nr:O-methyltransferase [bacterium]